MAMTQNELMESKLRDEGWLKLLPNETVKTSQPHRFRYISPDYSSGVVIIDEGTIRGVYLSPSMPEAWGVHYNQVPWDTELTESLPE